MKTRLRVERTQPHRDAVKAEVRAAVRRGLYRRGVRTEDLDARHDVVMRQAESLWGDWPRGLTVPHASRARA